MKALPILIVNAALTMYCFGQGSELTRTAPLQVRTIDKFESHGEVALQALLRFGAESKIPLGLVRIDDRLCRGKSEVTVEGESIAHIADILTRQIEGYKWTVKDGVLLIEPQQMPLSTLQLLNTLAPRFAAPRTTLEGLGAFLTMDVRAVFRPDVGTAGSLSRSPDTPLVGPIQMYNVTVEEVLNRIVQEGGGGQWILRSTPDDYRTAADEKFVDIINYAANPLGGIQRLSCAP